MLVVWILEWFAALLAGLVEWIGEAWLRMRSYPVELDPLEWPEY